MACRGIQGQSSGGEPSQAAASPAKQRRAQPSSGGPGQAAAGPVKWWRARSSSAKRGSGGLDASRPEERGDLDSGERHPDRALDARWRGEVHHSRQRRKSERSDEEAPPRPRSRHASRECDAQAGQDRCRANAGDSVAHRQHPRVRSAPGCGSPGGASRQSDLESSRRKEEAARQTSGYGASERGAISGALRGDGGRPGWGGGGRAGRQRGWGGGGANRSGSGRASRSCGGGYGDGGA